MKIRYKMIHFKKSILVAVSLLSVLSLCAERSFAQLDAITEFYDEYSDDDRFSQVYISGRILSRAGKIDTDDPEEAAMIKQLQNIKGVRILTSDEVDGYKMYKQVYKKLVVNSYELLMEVRDKDGEFKFLIKEGAGGRIQELLILSGEGRDFSLISFVGDINLDQIGRMGKKLKIGKGNRLGRLKDRNQ